MGHGVPLVCPLWGRKKQQEGEKSDDFIHSCCLITYVKGLILPFPT